MREGKRPVDRRTVLSGLGVGLAGLAGCDSNSQTATDEGGDTETDDGGSSQTATEAASDLKITGVWADQEQEDFMDVANYAMEQTGHNITYHPRTTDSLLTGTLMDYESGVATADIVVMPSPARIVSDAGNGHLASVGDVWSEENFSVDPARVTVDGSVYAAPFKTDIKPGFWYRKSFFDDNGLSEPGSYDEFLTLLDDISGIDGVDAPIASGNGTGWPLSDITEGFIMRQDNGAQLQNDLISGDADFTDQRVKDALSEIKSLHEAGHFSQTRNFGVQYEYFWDNSLPLYFMGSFTTGQEAVQDPSDLGVFRLPGAEGMTSSVNWFTIPSYSENKDAAKEVLGELISADGQAIWTEKGGFVPSHTNVPEDAFQTEIMASLPQMANEVTGVPDLDDALGDPFQSEFWSQLKGLWSTPGETNVDDMASALEEAQNGSLEE